MRTRIRSYTQGYGIVIVFLCAVVRGVIHHIVDGISCDIYNAKNVVTSALFLIVETSCQCCLARAHPKALASS